MSFPPPLTRSWKPVSIAAVRKDHDDIHDPASAVKKVTNTQSFCLNLANHFCTFQFLNVAEFRTGQPADVAAVVSFLAAEDAHFVTGKCEARSEKEFTLTAYSTGQTVGVDDGIHLS